jgi:ferredoxin-NADP reductase
MAAPVVQAKVKQSEKVSPTVTQLTLQMPAGFHFHSGQFVAVQVPPEPGTEKPLKGYYSAASSSHSLPDLQLLIEHHPIGKLSGHVSGFMSGLAVGTELMVEGPHGKFGLPADLEEKNYFLGSGVGMAPLRSMILDLLGPREDKTQVWLFLGAHGDSGPLMDAQWKELHKRHPEFHYLPVLQATADNPWVGKQADPADVLLRHVKDRSGATLYLAGFNAEVDPMYEKLLAAGFQKQDIKMEKFG